MAFNLKKVLRALLFSSSQPLSIKDIQTAFTRFHEVGTKPAMELESADAPAEPILEESDEIDITDDEDLELYGEVPSLVTAAQIREAMDELSNELRSADDSLLLIEGSNGYRLVTHPRFARWVRILRNDPPPLKLSRSALETLSIVAYRQPVTRAEIETIRGVSADAGINKLLERELIYIVGRADLPGRPIQYGTTDQFLEFSGVKSLDELPASDVLSSRQIDEWLQTAMSPNLPSADAEMGLPLEEGEGDTPNLEAVSVEHTTAAEPDTESVEEENKVS
jgi:segregation and condensation protein B|uniref:SMC-Scp complex subunit ScpB n=1 Tax=Cephaloticoccus sp. TaxID=1985742 RepID=UPI00404AEB94